MATEAPTAAGTGRTAPAAGARLGPAERREQLVAAGLELVKRRPLDQVGAADVAAEAGVSKALVFHYFPTTGDLHAAVLEAAAGELLHSLDWDRERPPGDRLRHGLDAFVTYLEQQPASYQILARSAGSDPRIQDVLERTRDGVVAIIGDALGTDELPPGLRIALRGWIALVEEMVLLWLVEDHPVRRDQLVDLLYQTAVTMLPAAAGLRPA